MTMSTIYPVNKLGGPKTWVSVPITTAASGLSAAIDLGGLGVASIGMSTAWVNATITFMGSPNTTANMASLRHTTAGLELAYVTTASRSLAVDPYLFSGIRQLQVRSGTAASAVAQTTAVTLILGLSPIV